MPYISQTDFLPVDLVAVDWLTCTACLSSRSLSFENESADADVVLLARPEHRDPSMGNTRLRTLQLGATFELRLPADGSVHIFSFQIGSVGDLSARIETVPSGGQSGDRLITLTFRGSSVAVVDSHADAPYIVGEALDQPVSADVASDLSSVQLAVGELLAWRTRSVEETRDASASIVSMMPSLRPGLSKSNWEYELSQLLERLSNGTRAVHSQAEKENVHAVPPSSGVWTYRLRDTSRRNTVLSSGMQGNAPQHGPRAVWSYPSHESPSRFLGSEPKDEVLIEEAVGGWLRYKPKPADSSMCWIKQETEEGRWEKVPHDSSASLQAEFFATSGLRLLLFSLNASEDAAALLLRSTEDFAKRVPPLALFETAGPALDQLLIALIDWAEEKCEDQLKDNVGGVSSGSSDRDSGGNSSSTMPDVEDMLLVFVRLIVARGNLPMLIRLAEFLSRHPTFVNGLIVDEIARLSDVRGFAEEAQLRFGPTPGSLDDLVAQCKSRMRVRVCNERIIGMFSVWLH